VLRDDLILDRVGAQATEIVYYQSGRSTLMGRERSMCGADAECLYLCSPTVLTHPKSTFNSSYQRWWILFCPLFCRELDGRREIQQNWTWSTILSPTSTKRNASSILAAGPHCSSSYHLFSRRPSKLAQTVNSRLLNCPSPAKYTIGQLFPLLETINLPHARVKDFGFSCSESPVMYR